MLRSSIQEKLSTTTHLEDPETHNFDARGNGNDAAGRGASVGFGKYGAAAEAEPLQDYLVVVLNILLNYLYLISSCLRYSGALRAS